VLVAVTVLRLAIAFVLPFTGDEAYYYFWGVYGGYGGYDHPGMVAWWLWPFVRLGSSEWLIRLPAVLLLPAVSWLTWRIARPAAGRAAEFAGIAVALVPAELLNVLTTTDTPLVLFCLASVLAYQTALRRAAAPGTAAVNRWHWIAGVLLGAALDSKYFAALLAIAFLVFALVSPRRERPWPGLVALAAGAVPLFALNLYWNFENCWLNILFNFFTRHDNVSLSVRNPAVYLVILAYLTAPLLLWRLARRALVAGPDVGRPAGQPPDPARRLVACALAVPLAAFGALSLVKSIGLHWPFAFTPLAFAAGAIWLGEAELRRAIRWVAALSGIHLAVIGAAVLLPLETWQTSRLYDGLVLTVQPRAVMALLEPYASDYAFATDGYSNSVTLSYARRRFAPRTAAQGGGFAADSAANGDFLVFGRGSAHGRQQDRYDDFRPLDRGNILVFRKTRPPLEEYQPFFDQVEYRSAVLRGVTYYLVLGRGFRYAAYRDQVLAVIRDRFYRGPAWLPAGHCFFCERYFGEARCAAAPPG